MKIKLKILASLAFAFLLTAFVSNTDLIAGTPYINRPFLAELRNKPFVFFQRTKDYLASLSGGKKGVENYQKERVQEYVTQQWRMAPTPPGGRAQPGGGNQQSPIAPPTRPEEFSAQGYSETAKDVYQKKDEPAKVIYVHVGADAKFEKRTIEEDGRQVEAWVPL